MARYYISADLEGVSGVTSPLQCYPKDDLTGYGDAVDALALEVNTVAETLLKLDPQAYILVNDAHSTMTNLAQEDLIPQIALLSGKPKLCAMMAGVDSSFDGAIFIGYHAKAGTEKGVLNHTFHSKLFDVKVNGVSYGEGGINALYASLVHQVPLILGSGDKAFCQEIRTLIPQLRVVETKAGLTTTAANNYAVEQVIAAYQEETMKAVEELKRWSKGNASEQKLSLEAPYTLEITFTNSLACDVVMTSPLYTRKDGRTVELTTDNFQHVYQGLQSAYTMLCYTDFME
jgi:D-amino peptidase